MMNTGSMSFFKTPLFLASLLLFASPLHAELSKDPIKEFPSRVKKITLKNGLRVLLVERPASPTVSFAFFIRTGALDDGGGKSGLAHMFEHMLFKGTKTIGTKDFAKESLVLKEIDAAAAALQREQDKGAKADVAELKRLQASVNEKEQEDQALIVPEEYWQIYERAGAQDFNAATGYDFTTYTISLPSNQVKLWMAMESDRMKNPVLREFYKERDVVMEERRLRIDNSPQGKLSEAFLAAAFMVSPYRRPIVGWESEISRVTRSDAEEFFKTHYDVSRLVVGIAGGFRSDEMEGMLKEAFGAISSHPEGTAPFVSQEPAQDGERRVDVDYDAEPQLLVGYHRPGMLHPDSVALDVISELLGSGRTSRFNRNIIEKKKIAVSAWAGSSYPGERDPNLFALGGEPRSPHTTADLEKALYAELEELKKNGPSAFELSKVKTNLEASVIRALSSNLGLASQLAYYEAVGGDWALLLKNLEQIRAVTAEDVKRVAGIYLTPSNRTVATLKKVIK